jgi:site-specific DNA-methyltransferase (adenine-specific)
MHPTQKPVVALLPLVHSFCPPSGITFDPFCGSGSSLVAAQHLGRNWLGMELDENGGEFTRSNDAWEGRSGRASA